MAPLRLLQVGLGPHGRNWARHVLPNIPEVDLVAYVDKDPYALDALREEAQVPTDRCFESLKEAIAATQPEAVLNTTALPAHVPLTMAALDAGLHVLVEKPFAPSLAAAQQLVEEARVRDLILMVSQNYRYFPAPRAIAAMVHESGLGKLYEVSIDFRRYSTVGPNGRGRHHLEEQPLLVDMSIHHFDLLRLILSREPQRIYCEAWNPEWTAFSGPSVAVASIVFEGGVVVSYRGSWISAAPVTPWAGEWRMEFENGDVTWTSAADSDVTQDRVVVRPRGGEERTVVLPAVSRTGTSGTVTEFVNAVHTGREPETSGRHNLGTIALMEAAVESAASRQPVTIHRTEEAVTI
ncbi:MAG TPA: Gfo/Idh/MocA family oxidoreductase [Candidatus Limnocylindrales bacterium]|nr:Gfo/Idh/MocA family oxidoreductase [Candidatus Limnocylindrales bacterium]